MYGFIFSNFASTWWEWISQKKKRKDDIKAGKPLKDWIKPKSIFWVEKSLPTEPKQREVFKLLFMLWQRLKS